VILKATAFSLRKTQGLLGIDSQIQIARPFLLQEAHSAPKGSHFTLDVSNLEIQYIRYKACFQFYKESVKAHSAQDWKYYLSIRRIIQSRRPVFFSGLINPSHDLTGKKINDTHDAIAMSCSVFTAGNETHALLSCPEGPSKRLYAALLQQLEKSDDQTFKAVMNNLLTTSAESLLMPEAFEMNVEQAKKVRSATQRATLALKGEQVLDLRDESYAVSFV
jgi:hypothetical protein